MEWKDMSERNAVKIISVQEFVFDIQRYAYGDDKVLRRYDEPTRLLLLRDSVRSEDLVKAVKSGYRLAAYVYDTLMEEPALEVKKLAIAVQIFDREEKTLLGIRCIFPYENRGKPSVDFLDHWNGKVLYK